MGNESGTHFDPMFLEHAQRCWEAERENAQRLGARVNLLVTAAAALLGLGLFRINWYRSVSDVPVIASDIAVVVIRVLLSLGLSSFALAFLILLRSTRDIQQEDEPALQAADHLRLSQGVLESPPQDADQVRTLVFARVYRAYLDLRIRNIEKRERLERGQQWFLIGLSFVVAAILFYLASSR